MTDNYPTWAIALWIDNDEGYYHDVRSMLRELAEYPDTDDADYSAYEAGKLLRDWTERAIWGDETPGAGIGTDLLTWALQSADWTELGKRYLDQLAEEDES